MTGDVTEIRYWIDLAIKMAIGVLISIIGLDYRTTKNTLQELQEAKYHAVTDIQIIQTELSHIKTRLDRIDSKLDQVLSR